MSFQQGLSGLNGAQRSLDAISNNVANSGTVGFKLSQAQFSDVYAAALGVGGGSQIGIGTSVTGVAQQFTQGNLTVTNNPLDVAINGTGFFRMSANGVISYSRNGQFNIDREGFIVNTSGDRLTGYAADAQGVILTSSPTSISIDTADLPPRVTTEASLGVNLDSRKSPPLQAFDPATNGPQNSVTDATSMSVYDTLGNPHVMTVSFIKLPPGQPDGADYTVFTSLDGGPAISPGNPAQSPATGTRLVFNTAGGLTTSMPLQPSFPISNGAEPTLAFELDLTGSTQFGSGFGVNKLAQDGYASGRLSGINISVEGIVQGRYSNGQARNLGQIVLANFGNPNGLQSIGNNQWVESAESGQPLIGAPGTGSLGVLQSAAVEESNVDLTAELVSMITQQRAYQANAQSIKTQDQVLQTLVNLR